MCVRYRFNKRVRLSNSEHYHSVFQKAHCVNSLYLTILSRENFLGSPRLGLAVPKKEIGNAVDRNNFKRLARESFRKNQHKLPNKDFVVIAKRHFQKLSNNETFLVFNKLWSRLFLFSLG
ncbi:ribonuclease P protein component [Candidatus Photodesmus katoptron]|uniref:Ribonuclease P protein component n=1 Tax=Candidatus Photodesmus katoptron Akat1 TaxID=1236703 RepID=S3EH96_9GAMM|nr:ribonuclease P protein component [Candidatus Photodesmus katoptron]EPE37558.1 ribonuclease P protein component [Candidatus Photodesmus katoptron Akat1]KEY90210.1 ribonuclease P protein component [Candidatus Photodesmus katoptron]